MSYRNLRLALIFGEIERPLVGSRRNEYAIAISIDHRGNHDGIPCNSIERVPRLNIFAYKERARGQAREIGGGSSLIGKALGLTVLQRSAESLIPFTDFRVKRILPRAIFRFFLLFVCALFSDNVAAFE